MRHADVARAGSALAIAVDVHPQERREYFDHCRCAQLVGPFWITHFQAHSASKTRIWKITLPKVNQDQIEINVD